MFISIYTREKPLNDLINENSLIYNEQVKEGDMPLFSYTLIHRDAKLTQAEKNELINWADGIRESLKAKYPMDSLIRIK